MIFKEVRSVDVSNAADSAPKPDQYMWRRIERSTLVDADPGILALAVDRQRAPLTVEETGGPRQLFAIDRDGETVRKSRRAFPLSTGDPFSVCSLSIERSFYLRQVTTEPS
jgi:hypothetical protein